MHLKFIKFLTAIVSVIEFKHVDYGLKTRLILTWLSQLNQRALS